MSLAPGSKLGPYEILAPLGAGGMGEVYRARDPRLGRVVAIKVLPADRMADAERRRRFVQEARAVSALNHPNIVTIHEIDSVEGIDFIVMEYVAGRTLDLVITAQGMRLPQLLDVAIPMADALARAHAAGIIHRDVKPSNVALSNDGQVKVLDFGLAKLVVERKQVGPKDETQTETSAPDALSRPGTVAGTTGYMSPEQATGGEAGGSLSSPSAPANTRSGSPTPMVPTRSSSLAGPGCTRVRPAGRRTAGASPSTLRAKMGTGTSGPSMPMAPRRDGSRRALATRTYRAGQVTAATSTLRLDGRATLRCDSTSGAFPSWEAPRSASPMEGAFRPTNRSTARRSSS